VADVTATTATERAATARAAVAENPAWYHTLELAPGVLTPGRVDLRQMAAKVLPDSLAGKRALDVGTFDGFWAFEMERRGADVVAIDLASVADGELPPGNRLRLEREAQELDVEIGRGFRIAAGLLGARARHVICVVLELSPEVIGGPVEVAFMGALLVHLRDPVRALERILATLTPGGTLYQFEGVSLPLSLLHPQRPVAHLQTLETHFNWWYPNRSALCAWLQTAGFVDIRTRGFYRPPQQPPMSDRYCAVRSRRPPAASA
jgi:SAM-dependent methyltransferase